VPILHHSTLITQIPKVKPNFLLGWSQPANTKEQPWLAAIIRLKDEIGIPIWADMCIIFQNGVITLYLLACHQISSIKVAVNDNAILEHELISAWKNLLEIFLAMKCVFLDDCHVVGGLIIGGVFG
jgi:hypothetical protein